MSIKKIVLLTGGNSGIGYEAARLFFEADAAYHIILAARTLAKATAAEVSIRNEAPGSGPATNTLEPLALDVTSDTSIQYAVEAIKQSHGRVDVLINNAGATFDGAYLSGEVSLRECFNRAYDVNVTGAHVLTHAFVPLLLRSDDPRLLFVAGLSHMTLVNDGPYFPTPPQPAGWPKQIEFETIGYRSSKTALNMIMFDWNHKLKADGIKVWGVGPGFLATNLGDMQDKVKAMGGGHPSEGAKVYKDVVEGKRDGEVGKVIDKDGLVAL